MRLFRSLEKTNHSKEVLPKQAEVAERKCGTNDK